MVVPEAPVSLTGQGLVLREWADADLSAMVGLFDEPEIAHRSPLASPFDLDAARAYLKMIRRTRTAGERLHLAITTDGDTPLGEVLLNLSRGSMGYAVGAAYRGRHLALRAVQLMTGYAHQDLDLQRMVLQIEPDNTPSIAVAQAAGFRPAADEPEEVEGKGRHYTLLTWEHRAPTGSGGASRSQNHRA